jgi:flagellar protein FliS
MNPTELAYRKTAVEGASGFGVLIALYDTMAGNLRRAAEAQRQDNIEKRCQEVNHALLVIGHLEDSLDRDGKGELVNQLTRFYASLRRKLIVAQARKSADLLEQQMALVLKVRQTWQELELRDLALPKVVPSARPQYSSAPSIQTEPSVSSWVA